MEPTAARIRLTPVRLDDATAIHRWKNDAELQALSSDSAAPESLAQTQARVRRWQQASAQEVVHFAIRWVDGNAAIGFCHLAAIHPSNQRCAVGIVIGERQYWGRGLGREALL